MYGIEEESALYPGYFEYTTGDYGTFDKEDAVTMGMEIMNLTI